MRISPSRVAVPVFAALALSLALAPTAQAATSPAPSPSATTYPCIKPTAFDIIVPDRAAAGATVHITGDYRDLCQGETSWPTQTIALRAGSTSETHLLEAQRATTDSQGNFAFDYTVSGSSQFQAENVDTHQVTARKTVVVDRVSGSCSGVVTLDAPPVVHVGDDVLLTGQRSDTSTVTIKARRRATTTFVSLATSTPDASGRFTARYQANDDYAVYAAGQRCDSPAAVVQIKPTIAGPATARRGTTVTLAVTGLPTAPVAVYFHKAGSTGYVKRRLSSLGKTGAYTTTFIADADYRYYAVVGNDHRVSNYGLTQVR